MSPDAAYPDGRRLPVGTVTFLLTDVVGSTRLWEQDEAAAAAVVSRHYELLATVIATHGGARPVEQGEGDSVVAAFASASQGVAAAIDSQLALAREPWPEGWGVQIRAALHTGATQMLDAGNYAGPTIIRCARLRNIASGGQTLVSDATRLAVVDGLPPGASLRALGVHRLKDLGRPERVWQLCHEELRDQFAPLRSLDAMSNNLPAQMTPLVGRDAELTAVADAIATHRVVTLTGAGGVGKSRLAAHAAAELVEQHADGVWWVDLAAVTDPALVAHSLASVLGLRKEPDKPLLTTLAEQLRGRKTLIVLDNCEQVLDSVSRLVDGLVSTASGVTFLATSREPLGLAGELSWRVPSLDEAASARLFVERAAQVRPGFDPDRGILEVIGSICERLDGLPLAIELAAARVRMMHPTRIAAALDDRFRLLTGGRRAAVARQQTLEASVTWSYDLLDERERLTFQRLAVFSGGFTLEAAESVCADGDVIEAYSVLDILTNLIDKSLVLADADIDGRYRMLETIRQYAQGRLLDSASTDAVRDRHLSYFLALAEHAAPGLAGAESDLWLFRLEADHDNLRAAFDWADGAERGEECLRLVAALAVFWELRGHLARGGRWFARALAHDPSPSIVRARALWGSAHVALYGDDIETAQRRAPEALEMACALGDKAAIARAQNTMSYMRLWFDPPGARSSLRESIDIARSVGDEWAVGDGLKMVTITWMVQDNWPEAVRAHGELHQLAAPVANRFFLAWCHFGFGFAALQQGKLGTARAELEAAAADCDDIGDPATGGLVVSALGELETITGRYDEAIARLGPYIQRAAASGSDVGLPFALLSVANLHLGNGRPDEARSFTEQLVEHFDTDQGLPMFRSWSLSLHGATLVAHGDFKAAGEALVRARELADAIGNPRLASLAQHHLGRLAEKRDESSEAEDLYHHALANRHGAGLLPAVLESLDALACLASRRGSHAEATRLVSATSHFRAALGLPRFPVDTAACDQVLIGSSDALDQEAFRAAVAEGAALALDEAVAYATRARGERKRPASGWDSLTPTELSVVRFTAQGLTNPQIAEKLFISRATVKTHLAHVFAKLGVTTRTELGRLATRHEPV